MELRPVCPQLIAKANPTPAGKLAFVISFSEPKRAPHFERYPYYIIIILYNNYIIL
jgi:hypothetical protein